MELRQIRFFVTLAEELHFGRAAEREHIVQSALSQQIRRLERELGVQLFQRDTHHVELTAAGAAFLPPARQMLTQAEQAAEVARAAGTAPPAVRVGIGDASCDTMAQILRSVQEHWPQLEIHQVEAGVPEQLRMLADGRLDVGFGRASLAPSQVASRLVRLDPVGVILPEQHPLARQDQVPLRELADQALLLPHRERAPEFNEFVVELCRSAGFTPMLYHGSVCSMRAAAEVAVPGRCMPVVPASCAVMVPGTVWRPLVQPAVRYPLSLLWRSGDRSGPVGAVTSTARSLARDLGWLEDANLAGAEGRAERIGDLHPS